VLDLELGLGLARWQGEVGFLIFLTRRRWRTSYSMEGEGDGET